MTTWVILAGLPGTGKSTLARSVSAKLHGVILDKDRVREALFPGEFTDYSREQDDLCMQAIFKAAAYLTAHGRVDWIFLDGRTYSRRAQLDMAVHSAEQAGAHWRILHVICADAIVEARLQAHDASNPARNRNMELYREVKARFEEVSYPHLVVNTTNGLETTGRDVEQYLLQGREETT